MRNASELIPALAAWNDGKGITVESWIQCIGEYDHAIGYASVLWPRFVVHEECVFRYTLDENCFREWMDACNNDRSNVEAAVNHLHLVDLFPNSKFSPTSDVCFYLGTILKEMWTCKLIHNFPQRHFDVVFTYEEGEEPTDAQVTFYQRR